LKLMSSFLEGLKIALLAVLAAMVYGVLHDQITARVCVECFTVGHPPVFDTTDPTLLALGWGIIATWWVGAFLGVPAAALAQIGPWPKVTARRLLAPIGVLLTTMAVASLLAGVVGYWLAGAGHLSLGPGLASRLGPEKIQPFLADASAHLAAYAVGAMGGIVLWVWILRQRRGAAVRP
jgi:hypothetical protein